MVLPSTLSIVMCYPKTVNPASTAVYMYGLYVYTLFVCLVVGCADMSPIELAYMQRSEDTLMVHCNNTQETWYLICKDREWLGQLGNCSQKG